MKKREADGAAIDSRAQQAYLTLRERILRADYPFGTILSPRQLAREFGVSMIPVAEALQRLEYEELVERRPRAGTRVKIPTPEDIRGQYIVREALESQAARLCAVQATAAERIELRTLAAELDLRFSGDGSVVPDRAKLYELHTQHLRLHTLIAEAARCQVLWQAIERNHVLLFNFLYNVASERAVLPDGFHSELVEPIIRGDPERADATMRAHVRYGFSETLLRLEVQIQKNGWRLGKNDESPGQRRKARKSPARQRKLSIPKRGQKK
jgi:DNA-binding GntR family transcriptional regulator